MDRNRNSNVQHQQQSDQINGNVTKRRTRIPDKPEIGLSLWSIIKSFIGKDLTKIPLPVNFNEPLSMLQKSAEDYEYSELLDTAAKCSDIAEQLAYVAAFTVTHYSTTSERVAKPFNPMLGETYECDRTEDMGWKCLCEQVSHHPPVLAQHCESKNGWKCFQEFQLSSKFRGKHITAIPITFSRIEFSSTGTSYTFNRPVTSVHNLIIGKLYVEHSGEVAIVGEGKAAGWKCDLSYQTHSFFSKDQRQVKGFITDPSGEVTLNLNAKWDEMVETSSVTSNGKRSKSEMGSKAIWRKRPPPSDSYLYYNFTVFASQLNEMEYCAPTDSRNRPDQRLMEDGAWDESNREKVRLEEMQRERRRLNQDVKPTWFSKTRDELTGEVIYKYTGNYWECKRAHDWSKCPTIF